MADDAGIADQTVGAAEGADVTAADGGAVNLDQSFSFLGLGHRLVDTVNLPGLGKLDGFHNDFPFSSMSFRAVQRNPKFVPRRRTSYVSIISVGHPKNQTY